MFTERDQVNHYKIESKSLHLAGQTTGTTLSRADHWDNI